MAEKLLAFIMKLRSAGHKNGQYHQRLYFLDKTVFLVLFIFCLLFSPISGDEVVYDLKNQCGTLIEFSTRHVG